MNLFSLTLVAKIVAGAMVIVFLSGASCTPSGTVTTTPTNFNPDYRLVIPSTAEPYVAVNGDNDEARWTNDAFDLGFVDGTDQSDAKMMGVADATNLYLYFELEEVDYSTTDTIVVLIAPDPGDANDNRLLLIQPCKDHGVPPATDVCSAGLGNNKIGTVVYHLVDSGTGNWDAGEQDPALLDGKIRVETITAGPGLVRYGVEVELSRADFNLPSTGYFGLYTNIMQADDMSIGANTQYTWPYSDLNGNAGGMLIYGDLTNLPADSVWGNATLDNSNGPGVFIVSSDVFTNHSGGSTISTDEENTFTAIARSADNSATGLAEDVVATFRWANFGLPSRSAFHKIPTDAVAAARGNPPPAQDIPPTASATYEFDWSVSDEAAADQADYTDGSHWCVKVELTAAAGVTFYRDSAQRNMNFAETSSPFTRVATISAEGIKPPSGSRVHDYILEERFYNFDPKLKWKSELEGVEKIGEGLYRVQVPVEQAFKMDMSVLPPAEALVPYKTIKLGADGQRIDIEPGMLITLLEDEVKSNTTDIRRERLVRDASAVRPSGDLVDRGAAVSGGSVVDVGSVDRVVVVDQPDGNAGNNDIRPRSNINASWGDADGGIVKKSAFTLGRATTLLVPKGAKTLNLRLDGEVKSDRVLRIYATKLESYHLFANPDLKNEGNNIRAGLGANLPTVVYRGKRGTGRTITIDKKRYTVYEPAGSFSYIVKGSKTN